MNKDSSMNKAKTKLKHTCKKRKREKGKSLFLEGYQAGFSGLPPHLFVFSIGMNATAAL